MKSLFIGRNISYLKSVGSTNSYAAEILEKSTLPEGAVFVSFNQLNGRGQRGNLWLSEPNKNIAFSVVLYPKFLAINNQFLITKIISLSVCDLLAEIFKKHDKKCDLKIKWPNDIYVNDKKIAGILIENTLSGSQIKQSIVGIGININQQVFDDSINATSVKQITDSDVSLEQTVEMLCEYIESRYLQLRSNKTEVIDKDYFNKVYLLNEWKNYSAFNSEFEGRIVNVTKEGKLMVELKSGNVQEFFLKEIQYLKQ